MSSSDLELTSQYLSALRLPNMAGKRFLFIGSHSNTLPDFAVFSKATDVVLLDDFLNELGEICLSKASLDNIELHLQSLKSDKYDVIFLGHIFHSIANKKNLVSMLMDYLSINGLLVMDIYMAIGTKRRWTDFKIDEENTLKNVPTRSKLTTLLAPYAWKVFGKSIEDLSPDLTRRVVHIKHKKPYVFLMLEKPASGKSTLARHFFKEKNVPVISGDSLYIKIGTGKTDEGSRALTQCIQENFKRYAIDKTIHKVFKQGLHGDFLELLMSKSKGEEVAIDTYIPEEYWNTVMLWMREQGYFPILMSWGKVDLISPEESNALIGQYIRYLKSILDNKRVFYITKTQRHQDTHAFKWCIDSPVDASTVCKSNTVKLSGWVCFDSSLQPDILLRIRSSGKQLDFKVNRTRKDVVSSLSSSFANLNQSGSYMVGFSYDVERYLFNDLDLYLVLEGAEIPLAKIETKKSTFKFWK